MSRKDISPPSPGENYVWASGTALALILVMTIAILLVILCNGLGFFWPKSMVEFTMADGSRVMGEITGREKDAQRVQLKIGNRDMYGLDFKWFEEREITGRSFPEQAVFLERMEYGNFFGYLKTIEMPDGDSVVDGKFFDQLQSACGMVHQREKGLRAIKRTMSRLNNRMESIRRHRLKLSYRNPEGNAQKLSELQEERESIRGEFEARQLEMAARENELRKYTAVFTDAAGTEVSIDLIDIVLSYQPNQLSVPQKAGVYLVRFWRLLTHAPRESNTEGGLFPAIFGTVLMVILMSIFCIPIGVIAAIYLREYAREGILVRLVRVAVNNLAGVPSIVYGVFGLGFFVYGVGGFIDTTLFPERLPTPTFGTGGILWASLTLALLTVPVVIVATEEALAAIPRGMREGSLALAATRWQTIRHVLLPQASPGIMTGFILAMSRAAGEVAPLMITGVVKLAPALPVDGVFPFLHLDRKFMHLGFHIYDVGFQSPNVEAAKPMVYVTALLLIGIVVLLNISAIRLRNRMRKKFTAGAF